MHDLLLTLIWVGAFNTIGALWDGFTEKRPAQTPFVRLFNASYTAAIGLWAFYLLVA